MIAFKRVVFGTRGFIKNGDNEIWFSFCLISIESHPSPYKISRKAKFFLEKASEEFFSNVISYHILHFLPKFIGIRREKK